ncbi:conserved hypothetical protein [Candida tropicalis MYA-3404]|uniref:Fe2OG dioxygenase domain-containing protein n=1 Tax=Candida tropicalis (strain ATCC MYA-3404 / T1) TaxID=294747 RepID=C5MIL5_CANTT|nr:conserved hypothetical protein [Candida tropicalis MYA-3404]EER30509.1 conserved hypothetical protein [Candida tropicalis MYA-3404]KAG4406373.1 hypothetical protein JTP64_003757 [Candida tropicalis]
MSDTSPVIVSLNELNHGLDPQTLNNSFGPDSLGIIVVKDLPLDYLKLREKVLTNASKLANLPKSILKSLENEESYWLVGWSCGKEKLNNKDTPDFKKGSYYINCAFHNDSLLEGPRKELVDKFPNYKAYTGENIYPPEELIPGFQKDIKSLINMIISVGESVATSLDSYILDHVDGYEKGYLNRVVKNSTCSKARLLHYFPDEGDSKGNEDDSWCGEHLDHSCITGLTSALYLNDKNEIVTPGSSDDSGLYIRNRHNEIVKVNIPEGCLAFQSGSTLQEVSKGYFKAVPHYVKGANESVGLCRNTLAVFMQPDLNEMVNDTENFAQYSSRILKQNH